MSPNRAERRAVKQGKVKHLFLRVAFTPSEAELIEEAMDMYVTYFEEELGDTELTDLQSWALQRARGIGAAMRAALENRPHYDDGERHAPTAAEPPSP